MALRPRPPSPSPKNAERAYLNVSDCVAHTYIVPMVYPVFVWVCNDIPHDIPERDPPHMYVITYVLCENRSLIQSLALMRSAINTTCSVYFSIPLCILTWHLLSRVLNCHLAYKWDWWAYLRNTVLAWWMVSYIWVRLKLITIVFVLFTSIFIHSCYYLITGSW